MKKTTVLFLVLVCSYGAFCGPYGRLEAYNDSLLVYNIYQSQLSKFASLRKTDYDTWHLREASDDSLTACAKVRLLKFNGRSYLPVATYDKEGVGSASEYPQPSCRNYPGSYIPPEKAYYYYVWDKQVRFLTKENGGTKAPYILKIAFDRGRLVSQEMMDPVTLQKLFQ